MCSSGMSPATLRARSIRFPRSQPERASGMRRDDDLVGLVLAERVAERLERIRVDDGAAGGDARLVEEVERPAQAPLGGRAALVLVDDVPGARGVLRAR